MQRTPDRILPGARDREPRGSLAHLATAMLAVYGCDRNGQPLRTTCPPVRKAPSPHKARAPRIMVKRPAFSAPAPLVAGTVYRIPSIRDEIVASGTRRAAVSRTQ